MSDQIGKILEKEEILRLQKEKLNENPGHEKEDIESIRKWIKQQPHLKNYGKTGIIRNSHPINLVKCFNSDIQFSEIFLLILIYRRQFHLVVFTWM